MKKRNLPLVVAGLVAIVILMLLNRAASNTTQSQSAQQAAQQPATPALPPKVAAADYGGAKALITEATIGDVATAKMRATFGYTMDTYVATHTTQVDNVLGSMEKWAKSSPIASAQIVCLDIPPALRTDPSTANIPLGLSINGARVAGFSSEIGPGMQWNGGLNETLYSRSSAIQMQSVQKRMASMKPPSPSAG